MFISLPQAGDRVGRDVEILGPPLMYEHFAETIANDTTVTQDFVLPVELPQLIGMRLSHVEVLWEVGPVNAAETANAATQLRAMLTTDETQTSGLTAFDADGLIYYNNYQYLVNTVTQDIASVDFVGQPYVYTPPQNLIVLDNTIRSLLHNGATNAVRSCRARYYMQQVRVTNAALIAAATQAGVVQL